MPSVHSVMTICLLCVSFCCQSSSSHTPTRHEKICRFIQFTQVEESTAREILEDYGWHLDRAMDGFYEDRHSRTVDDGSGGSDGDITDPFLSRFFASLHALCFRSIPAYLYSTVPALVTIYGFSVGAWKFTFAGLWIHAQGAVSALVSLTKEDI